MTPPVSAASHIPIALLASVLGCAILAALLLGAGSPSGEPSDDGGDGDGGD